MTDLKFHKPKDLKKLVDAELQFVPSKALFDKPEYQKLQEKWCAAAFGIGYEKYVRPCSVGVNDTPQFVEADFFLQTEDVTYSFQITEVLEKGRKRGAEYKAYESGEIIPYTWKEPKERISSIREAIENKVKKHYSGAAELNLLVYVNIKSNDLEYANILESVTSTKDKFSSIWLISNSRICSFFSKPEIGQIIGWREIGI